MYNYQLLKLLKFSLVSLSGLDSTQNASTTVRLRIENRNYLSFIGRERHNRDKNQKPIKSGDDVNIIYKRILQTGSYEDPQDNSLYYIPKIMLNMENYRMRFQLFFTRSQCLPCLVSLCTKDLLTNKNHLLHSQKDSHQRRNVRRLASSA